jgi:hypothetical protein
VSAIVRSLVVALTAALSGGHAEAAWLTIRNDTNQELVIQEFVTVNGQPKLGRVIKLQPGEAIRENKHVAGTRGIRVFDPARPKTPLLIGTLKWEKDDVTFTLKPDQQSVALDIVTPKKP